MRYRDLCLRPNIPATLALSCRHWTIVVVAAVGIQAKVCVGLAVSDGAMLRTISSDFAVELVGLASEPELVRVERVHQLVNQRINYTSGHENSGRSDYWATPRETLRV